jgi:hypothetical protein
MNALPTVLSGIETVYDLYKSYKNGNNTLGMKKKEMRGIGHYNKQGRKLAIYHG